MASKSGRFMELEGLRGIAAIVVAGYHLFLAFYTFALWGPGGGNVPNMHFETILHGNPVMVFLSGTFAVAIFFVLSGFVLSVGFFETGRLEIIKKLAAKRYLRLMLPALASILIAYILIKSGISQSQEAASLSQSPWLAHVWIVVPHFFEALYSGVVGIFVLGSNPYNAVLWTMTLEFLGSFLVFCFLALFANARYKPLLYTGLIFFTFNSWFMAFVAGMILADLYASGRLRQVKRNLLYIIPLMLVALFLGGYPVGDPYGSPYQAFAISGMTLNWLTIYLTFGAILLVGIVLSTTQVANIFRLKWISGLGKYTFSLYLVHTLILFSLTTTLFVVFRQNMGLGYNRAFLFSALLSIPVLIATTYLFERYVDAKAIKFSSWATGIILRERTFSVEFLSAYKEGYDRASNIFTKNIEPVLTEEAID